VYGINKYPQIFVFLMKTNGIPCIPKAPKNIQKGVPLKDLLGVEAIDCLAHNILLVHQQFDETSFRKVALNGLKPLGIMERGQHLAKALRQHLPENYTAAIEIILASLTPPLIRTEDNGLAVFFYLPHSYFVAMFGLDFAENGEQDPFEVSMQAQYEITQRFSAEFSIRPFLIQQQERTLAQLMAWTSDANPHVRRLCSEGTRSRLPWGVRIPAFITNPEPVLPILEALKCDESLYVRRSVANHLGDIAKDHPDKVFEICDRWLKVATPEVKWLIRHALRHPAKKGDKTALELRAAAK
jgi:3-methyladenine DNA glycosylase AlkC